MNGAPLSLTQIRLTRLALIVALLALWELYARFISTSSLIAGPSDVVLAWWPKVMGDPGVRLAVGVTLIELVIAFTMSVVFGMRNVSPLLVGSAAAMGATRAQQIRYVIFPHMVGTVFAGLRLAMTLTLLGVVLAEIFVSQGGIGFYTLAYSETFNPAALMALVLTLALMAIALNELVRLVETRFSRWKD